MRTSAIAAEWEAMAERKARTEGVLVRMAMGVRVGMFGIVGILGSGGAISLWCRIGGVGVLRGLRGSVVLFTGLGAVGCGERVVSPSRFEIGDEVPEGSGLIEITNGRHGLNF